MSLNLAATVSPDTIIISFTILAISYALHLKFEKEKINIIDIVLFSILCMIPTVCKIVYFPLLLLFFILPIIYLIILYRGEIGVYQYEII